MWIASSYGFFSIVKKDGGWQVRARKASDLKELQRAVGGGFAKLPIQSTPHADYCARVGIPETAKHRETLGLVFARLAGSIDYANFKDHISALPSQRGKLNAYHDIWGTMMGYQRHQREN